MSLINTISSISEKIKYIRTFPRETIHLDPTESATAFYRLATKRHPRYLIIPFKAVGVALLQIPDNFDDFIKGHPMRVLRQNRNRALKSGYQFKAINTMEHLNEVLEINSCTGIRQGRQMPPEYFNAEKVETFTRKFPTMFGVVDSNGVLRSYIIAEFYGEICVLIRILGHVEHESDGIMYLMVGGLVEYIIEKYPRVKWIMYDTFVGAPQSLRFFKEKLGFRPYWVHWDI